MTWEQSSCFTSRSLTTFHYCVVFLLRRYQSFPDSWMTMLWHPHYRTVTAVILWVYRKDSRYLLMVTMLPWEHERKRIHPVMGCPRFLGFFTIMYRQPYHLGDSLFPSFFRVEDQGDAQSARLRLSPRVLYLKAGKDSFHETQGLEITKSPGLTL